MPEELDPEWEYWMPSLEWLEAMEDEGRYDDPMDGVFAAVDADYRPREKGTGTGFRFGRGSPDNYTPCKLGRPRYSAREVKEMVDGPAPTRTPPEYVCEGCGRSFASKVGRSFCSRECANRTNRGGWGTSRFTVEPPPRSNVRTRHCPRSGIESPLFQEVVRRYLDGVPINRIEVDLRTTERTVRRILREAGLK
jgi:hypothetical protein